MAIAREQRIQRLLFRRRLAVLRRHQCQPHLAPAAAQAVDQLVLEDADQVGAQRRLAGKALRVLQRGQQRFRHRVFRQHFIAQLQAREAQQVGPYGLQFGRIEAHGGASAALGDAP
ncbi:hypothetical protein D9M71_798100 [compost metagenome]